MHRLRYRCRIRRALSSFAAKSECTCCTRKSLGTSRACDILAVPTKKKKKKSAVFLNDIWKSVAGRSSKNTVCLIGLCHLSIDVKGSIFFSTNAMLSRIRRWPTECLIKLEAKRLLHPIGSTVNERVRGFLQNSASNEASPKDTHTTDLKKARQTMFYSTHTGRTIVPRRTSVPKNPSLGGRHLCLHGKRIAYCPHCGGWRLCVHQSVQTQCFECSGDKPIPKTSKICKHNQRLIWCKRCRFADRYCIHNKRKDTCLVCSPHQRCGHNRRRSRCRVCFPEKICPHHIRRITCKICSSKVEDKPLFLQKLCKHKKRSGFCFICDGFLLNTNGKRMRLERTTT